jgi:HTH-type transcriptional regulator / antitoxin HipB
MITNEIQYRTSKQQAVEFAISIEQLSQQAIGTTNPLLRQAELDAMASTLEELQADILDYEALKRHEYTAFTAHSLEELPLGLIRARIALGFSQEKLAKVLGVSKQQVQRDEDNLYASANLKRLQAVAEALGVQIDAQMQLLG